MDENICKTIIEHKKMFVPHLFTQRQVDIMSKYLQKSHLNNTEKAYFYSTIKKKISSLNLLKEEFYITGQKMIPARIKQAKQILKEINKKAFISGSFLYKKDYVDIDIYVISNRKKSYHKDGKHFMFITEKMLRDPIFFSSFKYSVANFSTEIKPIIKREDLEEFMFTYQWVINQILDKEDQKELRDIVFQYNLQIKQIFLDSYTLYKKTEEIKKLPQKERIRKVNQLTKEVILKTHSKSYIYNVLSRYSKDFVEMGKEYKTDNIPIFIKFAQEVKNACRRT